MTSDQVTEPGVYADMPEEVYHADPVPGGSLSHSGAKTIITQSPMHYMYNIQNPPEPSEVMDIGTATHQVLLEGDTSRIDCLEYDDWRTKASKEARDLSRELGRVPILRKHYDEVMERVEAYKKHELASGILSAGNAEQSMFWIDPKFDIWRRSRVDWVRDGNEVFMDLKVFHTAHPMQLQSFVYDRMMMMQAAWYMDGIKTLGLCKSPKFYFAVQETSAPYPVTLCKIDGTSIHTGHALCDMAIKTYVECKANNTWPGYASGVVEIGMPKWAEQKVDYVLGRADTRLSKEFNKND